MTGGATPKIRLSLAEWGQMLVAYSINLMILLRYHFPVDSLVIAWPMTKAMLGNAPWRMFGSTEARRDYWRNAAVVMIRTGGYWFSIRHLQYLMPNDRNACRLWGWMNGTSVTSEVVELLGDSGEGRTNELERSPWLHWIGPVPSRASVLNASNQTHGRHSKSKILLYIHGGGFVLPLSNGSITMMKTLLRETNTASYSPPVYLALAEYTISPYAEYPTQILQCISIVNFLHSEYGIDSSNLVIAGDSCGGSIALSLLSQLLHPSPALPALPYTKGVNAPLAGVLLMSPWTSLATTAPSYTSNADTDTLPPNVIRRFRDTYMSRSALEPAPVTAGHKRMEPMEVASLSGRYYDAIPDPPIKHLEHGAGAIRPLESFGTVNGVISNGEDGWWKDIALVARKVMITAGEHECFRDDILQFARTLQRAANTGHAEQHSSNAVNVEGGSTGVDIELVEDESFHAVLVSDFAFGIPPGDLAAKLSGWLVKALRDQEM